MAQGKLRNIRIEYLTTWQQYTFNRVVSPMLRFSFTTKSCELQQVAQRGGGGCFVPVGTQGKAGQGLGKPYLAVDVPVLFSRVGPLNVSYNSYKSMMLSQ